MNWKLFTRDENVRPAVQGSDLFPSEDAALEKAYEIIEHPLRG